MKLKNLNIWVRYDFDKEETKLALEFESLVTNFFKENKSKLRFIFSQISNSYTNKKEYR